MKSAIKPIRSTLVGGVMFLLPVVVILVLLQHVVVVMRTLMAPVVAWIPFDSPWAEITAAGVAIVVLLFLCFVAGLAARRAFGRFVSETIEAKVHDFYPRYTVIKSIAQTMHGEGDASEPKMVLARFDDSTQIGFEMERADDGTVTVFLPGSPDPWSGSVALMSPDRIEPLATDYKTATNVLKRLGAGAAGLVNTSAMPSEDDD